MNVTSIFRPDTQAGKIRANRQSIQLYNATLINTISWPWCYYNIAIKQRRFATVKAAKLYRIKNTFDSKNSPELLCYIYFLLLLYDQKMTVIYLFIVFICC